MKTPLASWIGRHTVPTAFLILSGLGERLASAPVPRPRPSTPPLTFAHLSVEDGLSHADVRSMVQDRQGFMWFGTVAGLNRYDGHRFKVYQHDLQDPRSLLHDSVMALIEDGTGTMWVGTNGGGLDRYDRDSDSFVHYRHNPVDPGSLPQDNVKALYEDSEGVLWVGTDGGLARFDRRAGTFLTYKHDPRDPHSLSADKVYSIAEDPQTGLLWLGTIGGGISLLDRATGRFTSHRYSSTDSGSLSSDTVQNVYRDATGQIWVSTQGAGLERFDRTTGRFNHYRHDPGNPDSLIHNDVYATCLDTHGRFWVATSGGLDRLDSTTGTFVHYLHDAADPKSLSNDRLSRLYEDNTRGLWIGTADGGINRLAGEPDKFDLYRGRPDDSDSLSSDVVQAVFADRDGVLWVGTGHGLNRLEAGGFRRYFFGREDRQGATSDNVRALGGDAQGGLWIGTNGGGLIRLDRHGLVRYRYDPANEKGLSGDIIDAISGSARGGVWIGVHRGGLDYFDRGTFTHYRGDGAEPRGLPTRYVLAIYEDPHGIVWLGSNNMGLIRFDPAAGVFTPYLLDPDHPNAESGNRVRSIYPDRRGVLWLGTESGLVRFDPASRAFVRRYTRKDGLPATTVVCVTGDAGGSVWASTAAGLARLEQGRELFRTYDRADGLQSNQFSDAACATAPDGRMFFGGVNGLNAFYPDRLADNRNVPQLVLTDLDVLNEPAAIGGDSPLQKAIHVAREATLRHDQSVFTIGFAALNFTSPAKNRYAYKMEGFDSGWRSTDAARPFATYTNLDPGRYVFRVRGANNDGVWNDTSLWLSITILPPWWRTLWFRALAGAMLAGLAFSGYRVRVRTVEERERRFRTLADHAPDIVARFDRELRYLYINPAVEQYIGLPAATLIGRTNAEVGIPGQMAGVWERDAARVFEGGRAMRSEFESTTDIGARSFESLLTPEPAARSARSVLVVTRDITDRRCAEEALKRSEERYRSLVDNLNEVVFVLDGQQRLTYVSKGIERISTYRPDEVTGRNARELVHQDDWPALEAQIANAVAGAATSCEFRVLEREGSVRWVRAWLQPLYDQGKPVGVTGLMMDVTERRRLEEQLLQAQKMEAVGRLAGGVAHDFNNLLTVIMSYSRLLRDGSRDAEEKWQLEQIEEAADRAAALTHQLLAFSRRQILRPRVFDLNALLTNLDKLLRRLIGEDIEMVTVTEPDLGPVRADPAQIEQVIMNLAVNARDAMPNGGALTLETANAQLDPRYIATHHGADAGDYVMLAVSDTGMGMDAKTQTRIFEPFFTTKQPGRGTGLGLATVYGIVKQSGGYVGVYSEPGRGTTFKIYLPRVAEPVPGIADELAVAPSVAGTETILLVEDEPRVRELANHVLTSCGYRLLVGEDPDAALSLCRSYAGPIDLLITDVVMPKMNGRELAAAVEALRPGIKVLYMSGYTLNAVVHHGVIEQGLSFLQKPFTPASLTAKVREVLGGGDVHGGDHASS